MLIFAGWVNRPLRKAVNEYKEHYPLECNHQGLDNELIEKLTGELNMVSAVAC
jgi:hypothetical protein